jgi:hypothetical protein
MAFLFSMHTFWRPMHMKMRPVHIVLICLKIGRKLEKKQIK